MDVINKFKALTHLQRASARVVRSVMTDHSTFAVFLDTAGYLARWQRFMILITLVLSTLLTSIWCAFGVLARVALPTCADPQSTDEPESFAGFSTHVACSAAPRCAQF